MVTRYLSINLFKIIPPKVNNNLWLCHYLTGLKQSSLLLWLYFALIICNGINQIHKQGKIIFYKIYIFSCVLFFIDYCLIHELCLMNGQSNESNPCQLCNASQSKDTWTENPGMLTQCSHQLLSFCFYQTL